MRSVALILLAVLLNGCTTLGYKQFYSQTAPSKYPPTDSVLVFQYANVDIKNVYDLLFSDYLIIGRSSFNGPFENPEGSQSFAKSIGTDILITSSQFKETRTAIASVSTPSTSTTYISGYGSGGYYSGSATTYGTQTHTYPIRVDRYDQEGLFLKNVNGIKGLWEKKRESFPVGAPTEFDGSWANENYKLDLYGSLGQVAAFVIEAGKDRGEWPVGQLKFFFSPESKKGIYLMGNRTPMPATFEVNKFGHLEVKLIGTDESFSFARK